MNKKKIFKIVSLIFIIICFIFYGYRFIHYYKIYESNDEGEIVKVNLSKKVLDSLYKTNNYRVKDDTYYINNKENKNYVKYSGLIWRVVSISPDKEMKLITDNSILLNNGSENIDYLNEVFFSNLESSEAYLAKTEACMDNITDLNNITCKTKKSYNVGILSLTDYELLGGIESYLVNNENWWLSNSYNNGYYYVNQTGNASYTETIHNYGLRPVITLNKDILFTKGNGTIDNPYFIGEETGNILNQKLVGEYISFNDSTWRIISKEDIGVKVALNASLENRIFDSKSNSFLNSNLYNYLNKDYYDSIKNKDYIAKGTWYTGYYNANNDFSYKSIYDTKIEAYIGLLNINDLFIMDVLDSYLITPVNDYSATIYLASNSTDLYAELVSKSHNIRPALYLNSNIKIVSGEGTINKPYVLGLI